MKVLLFFVAGLFTLTCRPAPSQEQELHNWALRIAELCKSQALEKSVSKDSGCVLKAKEIFKFSWDRLYVFDPAVEDNVIRQRIGSEFTTASEIGSVKWFFMREGKVILLEEKPIQKIDRPVNKGDVKVEITDALKKFSEIEPEDGLEVNELQVGDGTFTYLKCVSCKRVVS
jgi:hypothetical protein